MSAYEARLIEQLRQGDADAGYRFTRDYYPGIYRYLLYLTRRPEMAEDLAQETFLQAWCHLDRFEGRAPLRVWLHRIAHREFLQALRGLRPETALDEIPEPSTPTPADWTEAAVLRDAIQRLSLEEREVVVLHHLEGYSYSEIGRIVRAPVSTVKYRLSAARAHLQRELGEGDLDYLNESGLTMRRWAWLPLEALTALEARLSMVGGRWSMVKGETTMSEPNPTGMSRRRLLETAGSTAAAVAASGLTSAVEAAAAASEAQVVDERLTRKVTLAVKAIALADLCEQLRAETGIQIAAGPSVADEKVTLFCENQPLRNVMRQLSRPFGYTWLRTQEALGVGRQVLGKSPVGPNAQRPTPNASFRYELVQDLRSQLLEEELRNRDRNAALIALDREIERFRPYLSLSPDEARARAGSAGTEEKRLLEQLAGMGWGPIQMYFRLSASELAALRAGETLTFSEEPEPGERPLPREIARGVLRSYRDWRVQRTGDRRLAFGPLDLVGPGGEPATAVPEARALVTIRVVQCEWWQFILGGQSGVFQSRGSAGDSFGSFYTTFSHEPYAVGQSPSVLKPDNASANAKRARDPALQRRVTVLSDARRQTPVASSAKGLQPGSAPADTGDWRLTSGVCDKLTSADVLEALHRATGLPIVADYYTRLYQPEALAAHDQPLFEALNHLGDATRIRWNQDGHWLQFRSTSFYDDRIEEVPNRLLTRWSASRREHGMLTLDDLVEIAQLPNAQLDPGDMTEGAKEIWGLAEWDLPRTRNLRPHLRYLSGFTPEQRQEAMSAAGLPFSRMSLAQQQQFLAFTLCPFEAPLQSMEDLAGATLRVDYSQPGGFQWGDPKMAHSWFNWVVPIEPGLEGRRALRPLIRERTHAAALEAVQRLDPHLRQVALQTVRDWLTTLQPQEEPLPPLPAAAQIFPTELALIFVYMPGLKNARTIRILHGDINNWQASW